MTAYIAYVSILSLRDSLSTREVMLGPPAQAQLADLERTMLAGGFPKGPMLRERILLMKEQGPPRSGVMSAVDGDIEAILIASPVRAAIDSSSTSLFELARMAIENRRLITVRLEGPTGPSSYSITDIELVSDR